jgi:hypothetical protein
VHPAHCGVQSCRKAIQLMRAKHFLIAVQRAGEHRRVLGAVFFLYFSIQKLIKQNIMLDTEKQFTSKEVRFNREKVVAQMQIAKECLSDIKLNIAQTSEDFMSDKLTVQLVGFIYSNTIDERKLEYNLERPTFFDWLFRRRKKVVFDFKAKDLMLNPPKTDRDKILRVYEIGKGESVSF